MAETLRELVVKLSMDSGNVSKELKGLATAVRQADANFKAAGAGVKGFEGSAAQAKARVAQLKQTLDAQRQAVAKQASALEKSKKKLVEVTQRQQSYTERIKAAKAALEGEQAASGKSSEASRKLADDLKKLEGQHRNLQRQAEETARGVQKGELALTQAQTAVKETEIALAGANKELTRSQTLWGKFGEKTKVAQEKLRAAGAKMSAAGASMTRGITMPLAAAGGAVLAASVAWENAYTGVRKTVNGTEEQMQAIHDGILKMSTELPSSASAIAQVAENAGQLGIETDNILSFSRTMIDLGNTTNLSADEGASALAKFANITQMSQKNFDRLGSVIVDLGNNFATTERDIVTMGTRIAAAGKQVGMTESNIMAVATAASSVGLEAEAGGTALSTVMLNIDMAAAKGGKAVQGYAKIAGMSAKDFAAAWKNDPPRALASFVKGLNRVKQEGGNVALTLEQMGYKEKRVRDALMRLSGAGDLLTGALSRADGAWRENIALTREAELRYGTAGSRLQMLKNKAIATGISFGNAMTPYLEKAMDALSGIIDKFGRMDPAMQENIVKWGLMAAAVGPVTGAVGKLMTGASFLLKAFSGPAGWIALAGSALAGLGVHLASMPSAAERAADALSKISFNVSEDSKRKITDGINAGIAAADKEHRISLEVNADTSALVQQLDDIFSDRIMTRKEWRAASDFAKKVVAPDLDAARKELEKKVKAYRDTLNSAVNAEGQPLSEKEKNALVDEFRAKNSGQIADLEAAMKEYESLLTTIKNAGGKATEEQVANLEKAIERVGALRKSIQEGQEEAIAAAKAAYNLTVEGGGNEKSMGTALSYVAQTRANEIADTKSTLEKNLAAAGDNAEAAAAAYAAFDKSVAAINKRAQQGFEAIAKGVAKGNPAIDGQIKKVEKLSAVISQGTELLNKDGKSSEEYVSQLTAALSKGGALRDYMAENKISVADLFSLEDTEWGDTSTLTAAIEDMVTKATEELVTASADPALNPMANMLKGMLDVQAFDALDPTQVEGPLLDMLKLVDLKTGGELLGTQIPDGIALGVQNGAAAALSAAQLDTLRANVDSAVRSMFQIHSPAGAMVPLGNQIPAGLAKGIVGNTGALVGAVRQLYAPAIAEVKRQEKLLQNAMTLLNSGGGGGNPSTGNKVINNTSTATVQVGTMVVDSQTDAGVMASQIAALNRRRLAGYGAI